jgi:hypothetical protein
LHETILMHDGWPALVRHCRSPCDFVANLAELDHPSTSLLALYREVGVPVRIATEPRMLNMEAAIARGPQPTANTHYKFLREELGV